MQIHRGIEIPLALGKKGTAAVVSLVLYQNVMNTIVKVIRVSHFHFSPTLVYTNEIHELILE